MENLLASYTSEEVVALLSAFVFQEKTDVEPQLPEKLQEGQEALLTIADRVGRVRCRPGAETILTRAPRWGEKSALSAQPSRETLEMGCGRDVHAHTLCRNNVHVDLVSRTRSGSASRTTKVDVRGEQAMDSDCKCG